MWKAGKTTPIPLNEEVQVLQKNTNATMSHISVTY